MTTHNAGLGIYSKLKVGDSVITGDGRDISDDPDTVILNNKVAERDRFGNIQIHGVNLALLKEINMSLSKEEWEALKEKF